MIPLIVEPTCISYNAANKGNHIDDLSQLKTFLRELLSLFSELKRNNIKIALTRELFEIYNDSVPYAVYSDSSLSNISREIFGKQLRQNSRFVHNYGEHTLEVVIDDAYINTNNPVINDDVYHHLLDLAGLMFLSMLPKCILKSTKDSIFIGNEANFKESKGDSISVSISGKITEIVVKPEMIMWNFVDSLIDNQGQINIESVRCSGTGTHSSMWGRRIETINDVPDFERNLLKKMIQTEYVKSITFLAFEKNWSSVETPMIVVNNISTTENSDIMLCTIRGKGSKQHCQDIRIELIKGGNSLASLCDNVISSEKLDALSSFVQAASAKYDFGQKVKV